jgi:hypothetical protein
LIEKLCCSNIDAVLAVVAALSAGIRSAVKETV